MQDFGKKNELCLCNFIVFDKRWLFAGYCGRNFEVGQQSCVGALEITKNLIIFNFFLIFFVKNLRIQFFCRIFARFFRGDAKRG